MDFTEMCSGSETGSYLRLIYFVYHCALGLGEIKEKRERPRELLGAGEMTVAYRGTSLVRKCLPLGPFSRHMPRALWWS